MRKIFAIAQKELAGYFKSPVASIILIITLSIFHIFFFMIIDESREASLRDVFKVMEFMFVFFVPLLTMKTFAEEKAAGTMEFLMTTPTGNTAIVLGKYLGTLLFFSLIIVLTGVYYPILEFFSTPDRPAILTGYIGIWLEGALFIAVGLLASSWTRSQVVAAIVSYLMIFLLYFVPAFVQYAPAAVEGLIRALGTATRLENFAAGLISTSGVVYYLSGIFFCLALTRLSIENRVWR